MGGRARRRGAGRAGRGSVCRAGRQGHADRSARRDGRRHGRPRAGRAALVAENARRLGRPGVMTLVGDGRLPPFPPRTFDRVLVDAPCSGLGTLRRRPDARWRIDVGQRRAPGRVAVRAGRRRRRAPASRRRSRLQRVHAHRARDARYRRAPRRSASGPRAPPATRTTMAAVGERRARPPSGRRAPTACSSSGCARLGSLPLVPELLAKVLTVSDGVVAGTREDKSGDALVEALTEAGFTVAERRVVGDGIESVGRRARPSSATASPDSWSRPEERGSVPAT